MAPKKETVRFVARRPGLQQTGLSKIPDEAGPIAWFKHNGGFVRMDKPCYTEPVPGKNGRPLEGEAELPPDFGVWPEGWMGEAGGEPSSSSTAPPRAGPFEAAGRGVDAEIFATIDEVAPRHG